MLTPCPYGPITGATLTPCPYDAITGAAADQPPPVRGSGACVASCRNTEQHRLYATFGALVTVALVWLPASCVRRCWRPSYDGLGLVTSIVCTPLLAP